MNVLSIAAKRGGGGGGGCLALLWPMNLLTGADGFRRSNTRTTWSAEPTAIKRGFCLAVGDAADVYPHVELQDGALL